MDQIEWNQMSDYERKCYNAGLARATGRYIPHRAVCNGFRNTTVYRKGLRAGRDAMRRETEWRRVRLEARVRKTKERNSE